MGDRLGDLTAEAFRSYGAFVGRHPGKVLVSSVKSAKIIETAPNKIPGLVRNALAHP